MKLPLLAMAVLLFSPTTAAKLSPSLPNSVCKRKKNQPQWLASSSSSSTSVACPLFLFPGHTFPPVSHLLTLLLKLQVASNPA